MELTKDKINEYQMDIGIWEDNIADLTAELEGATEAKSARIKESIRVLRDKIAKHNLLLSANNRSVKLTEKQKLALSKLKVKRSIRSVVVEFVRPIPISVAKEFFKGYEIRVLQGTPQKITHAVLRKK